jgi:hypothetical protein
MVIWPVIDYGDLVNVSLNRKGRDGKRSGVGGLRVMGNAGFCGPCVCLGVFLLL